MPKKILITRIEDDAITTYFSKYVEKKIRPVAEKKGFRIIDLNKEKATKKQVESALKLEDTPLVLFHGHGNDTSIAGYRGEILINSDDNANLLSGKIVHSLTCNSAQILGKEAISKHNTSAFIGYKEPFFALNNELSVSRPLDDDVAKPFLESSMKVTESLIKGNTTGEAFKKSQNAYDYWIAFYKIHGELIDASEMLQYLMADKHAQVILGDTIVSVSPA